MASKHLSELCSKGSADQVVAHLREVVPLSQTGNFIDFQDEDGRTAFHWATAMRHFALANDLLEAPNSANAFSVDHDRTTPLMTACAVGAPLPFVDKVLSHMISASQMQTCETELIETVQGAEESEKNPGNAASLLAMQDEQGNTALMYAVSRGHLQLVRFLLDQGAELAHQNRRGQTALHRAVTRGDVEVVEELILRIRKLDTKLCRRLLNTKDCRGDTALHYASMENNEDLGRMLIQAGVDRHVINNEGKAYFDL